MDLSEAIRWLNERTAGGLRLCIMHIEHVDRSKGGLLLSRLRAAYEHPDEPRSLRGVHLVLLGRDEAAFDIEPYSAFLPIVDTCRLPRFTLSELKEMSRRFYAEAPEADHDRVARDLLRYAGGQPLLTQLLFDALLEPGTARRRPPTEASLRAAYQAVRNDPPVVLRAWRARLARMIMGDATVHDLARDLARGASYPIEEAPPRTSPLCVSGWMSPGIGANADSSVWRFSDLHRHWAAAVFRDPTRFLSDSGRPR